MSRLFDVWRRLPKRQKRRVRKLWYECISSFDTGSHILFMNHGFAERDPAHKPLDLTPEEEPHRYAIQLYHRVARQIDWSEKDALEVGCGRGGGASFIHQTFRPRTMIGLDLTRTAIRFCERNYSQPGLSFRAGDAHALPFRDASFDIVLNVESSGLYEDPETFFCEVARVLRPGGHFLLADFRKKRKAERLEAQVARTPLDLLAREDLSKGVREALLLDGDRREALIDRHAPWLLRSAFQRFAHLRDQGEEIELFASGGKRYLSFVLQKPEVGATSERS